MQQHGARAKVRGSLSDLWRLGALPGRRDVARTPTSAIGAAATATGLREPEAGGRTGGIRGEVAAACAVRRAGADLEVERENPR